MQNDNLSKCCGCFSCQSRCPKNAITIPKSFFGPLPIQIDEAACIHCGLCEKLCPFPHPQLNPVKESYICYCKDNNYRNSGSSGGFFGLLASRLLSEGWLICGAAWNGLRVEHLIIDNVRDLYLLEKSKYVQSFLGNVFPRIQSLLSEKKKVAFVGTPCQVESLKKYLNNSNLDNLLLIDFLCHGVPTQEVFNRFVDFEETRRKITILSFSFRSKSRRNPHSFSYIYHQNKSTKQHKRTGFSYEFPYYQAYLSYSLFMEACYSCPFAQEKRSGDITLGDGWGSEKIDKRFSTWGRHSGVSQILINSENGQKIFSIVSPFLERTEITTDFIKRNNLSFKEPTKIPVDLFERIRHQTSDDFEKSVVSNFCPSKKQLFKAKLSDSLPRPVLELIHLIHHAMK
jgi:Coenzyme F420-reducing hydrogenase, beta subunit